MDDIWVVGMRAPATPSGIDYESEIVIGIETNGLSPELGGMGRSPYRPDSLFVIPV
jgi:hypothetical protein